MKNTTWFEPFISESLYISLIQGFLDSEQAIAEKKLLEILRLTAVQVLLEKTEIKNRGEISRLLESDNSEAIIDWLGQQPPAIIDSLRERLDRAILQIRAKLAAESGSAILNS